MLKSVPRRIGLCNGTETETLPLCLTAMNPCCSRMRHNSSPERTRSLPNRDLNLSHKHLAMHAARDLLVIRYFEKQGQSLNQVGSRFFNGGALASDIHFRA